MLDANTLEVICLIFSLIFLTKDKSRFWLITIAYLVVVVITELFAKYCGRTYHNNLWVYNIYTIFEAGYICYGLYYFINDYINLKKFLIATYILIIAIFSYFTFRYGILAYNAVTVSIMSVIFVIYTLLYFYLLLKDENYVDLKFHPAFWWIGGVLIFYFGGTIANIFDEIIQQKFLGKYNTRVIIYFTLNLFLYGFWSYSFTCRARQRKICP
ncbi:hypothetical protein [Pedobacter jejuensis]|uniref:Uncharacterized protein n=1 Tax=Pedobacter jejuensis TaxID=1268550 RepID=A0A3N0BNF1_9SPHI|nr:hypothetical protein [Pedobacter jejuensis]RNL50280.1 hypothetical protein D7004_18940 [Pedobacter jejuensis]